MGGVCGKPSGNDDVQESPRGRQANKVASVLVTRGNSAKREESFRVKDRKESSDLRIGSIDRKSNSSRRVRDEQLEKKKSLNSRVGDNYPVIRNLPNANEGELVAAGWPSWLTGVAAESIKGWIPRRSDTFEKLNKVS